MMKFRNVFGMVVLASFILLIALAVISITAEGQQPVVQASFEYSSKTANVEPGNPTNGSVSNIGEVVCNVGNKTEVTVNLAVDGDGWAASISPSNWTFYAGGPTEMDYAITVQAPIGTSHSVTQTVIVGGNWTADDNSTGDIDSSSMIVFIEQYFSVVVDPIEDLRVKGKEDIWINVTVWNNGNDEDDFVFEIMDYHSLTNSGWFIATIPKETIPEKESRDVMVRLTAPSKSRSFDIELQVFSEKSRLANPDDEKSETMTFTVKVDEDDDDSVPFLGPFELILLTVGVALFIAFRKRE